MVKVDKVFVTEHIMEIRHAAIGSFLDVRGFIADYIRNSGFLPHWTIDNTLVVFRDKPDKPEMETSFAGYKSFGYTTYNPPTKNFFQDRANSFINLIVKNTHYPIPSITRFGCRAKVFIPCFVNFDDLNKVIHDNFFSQKFRDFIGHNETDLQIISEFKDEGFNGRISFGPMHKEEIKVHLSFNSEHFSKVGLYFDIDYFKIEDLVTSKLQSTLKEAMSIVWSKVEGITSILGI